MKQIEPKPKVLMISAGGQTIVNMLVPDEFEIHDMVVVLKQPDSEGKLRIVSVK